MGVQLVWFKRDLRIRDHRPLAEAARRGPVLCLYVSEPRLRAAPDSHDSHWAFVWNSLTELGEQLRGLGGDLCVAEGEVVSILARVHAAVGVAHLWSHQETGTAQTWSRDRAVAAWCQEQGVPWTEHRQQGVVRRLRSRDGWAAQWEQLMRQPVVAPPRRLHTVALPPGALPAWSQQPTPRPEQQEGGSTAGRACLRSFLKARAPDYREGMSSPLSGWTACSRLSPHLAWGTLSSRQVYQTTLQRHAEVRRQRRSSDPRWAPSLQAFAERLRWRCHFAQKLERAPRIEHHDLFRPMARVREEHDPVRFEAWATGNTGWPLVDACMRSLVHRGWLNFRMRALLVSVATHHLWLPWRPVALHLARHFVDYDPGIHYPQVQMQAGSTGINALRIYNPTRQAHEQDPTGAFIRRFVPELESLEPRWLATPWRAPADQRRGYPEPLVDHHQAAEAARRRLEAVRQSPEAREAARRIHHRHGSRRPSRW